MLTTRGWALAAGNLALLIAGRLFGIRELFEVGLGLATLVITSCIIVRRGRHQTRLSRAVDPVEVYPGTVVRVEVTIRAGARRSPPLLFVEELPVDLAEGVPAQYRAEDGSSGMEQAVAQPRRTAQYRPGSALTRTGVAPSDQARRSGRRAIGFPVGAIEAHELHHVAYRIVPTKRGRYEIGPGSTIITDPFGLARAPDRPLAKSSLLVFPAFEALLPMAAASPHSIEGAPRPMSPTGSGEDFFTMREYQPGDDVKKIHWRTTARQGRMMVRQEDRPSEPRAVILLDDRRSAHARRADGADSFEACITSAASLIHLFTGQDLAVGLALASRVGGPPAAGGPGAPSSGRRIAGVNERVAKGPDHERLLMQRLAVLGQASGGDLSAAIGALLEPRLGATYLAVVTTAVDPAWELSAGGPRGASGLPLMVIRHLRHSYLSLSTAEAEAEEEQAVAGALVVERAGGTVVNVRAGETLGPAWEQRLGVRPRWSGNATATVAS
ncbi:MAG TPA: DUF58 domain-containing protein [Actinomycetota bacterium]|nr:DUF58 domain-containing protein [Actinomycetota bacterium]